MPDARGPLSQASTPFRDRHFGYFGTQVEHLQTARSGDEEQCHRHEVATAGSISKPAIHQRLNLARLTARPGVVTGRFRCITAAPVRSTNVRNGSRPHEVQLWARYRLLSSKVANFGLVRFYGRPYHIERPPPCLTSSPFITRLPKVVFRVLGLAPYSRTMSLDVTRP